MFFKVRRAYFIISCIIRSEIFLMMLLIPILHDSFFPLKTNTDLFNFFLYFKQYPLIWAKLELIV